MQLLIYFESSRFWTPWNWIKQEWMVERKDGRLRFLQECKQRKLLPRFLSDSIRTDRLFDFQGETQQATVNRERYGREVLNALIREEFKERKRIMQRAHHACREMLVYNREEYVFTKKLKEQVVNQEKSESRKRLNRKLSALISQSHTSRQDRQTAPERKRVTCIDIALTEGEQKLLAWGPKFVLTKGSLSKGELRTLESQIETTACALRREIVRKEESDETDRGSNAPSILADPKIRKLASPAYCQVKQPPKADARWEQKLITLKETVLRAYKTHKPKMNISKEEKAALKTLKERDLVVKCSDKSKSLVVMSTEKYYEKVMAILSDANSYEVSNMTSEDLEERVKNGLKKVKSLKQLPKDIYRGLFPTDTRLPEFYGLPKIHKANTPLRPVVAAFGGALSAVSILMERILNQLLKFVPAHIKNTHEACQSLMKAFPNLQAPENTILVTMDVVALYPSIPIDDGIEAVVQKLEHHQDSIDMLGLSIKDIEYLLRLILTNNLFTFDGKVYRQRHGIAMGNHLAPPLAITFMDSLEQKMLSTAEKKPELYDRYVDDCLLAWIHGEHDLEKFIDHCNRQHPAIRFTYETSSAGRSVSFMDMSLTVNGNGIEYQLFQKPSDSGVSLNYESATPMSTKMAVAIQQFKRAATLSSNEFRKSESFGKIEELLTNNNYPSEVIEQAKDLSEKLSKRSDKRKEDPFVTLKLPFLSDQLHRTVSKTVGKLGLPISVKLVYSQGTTLKKHFVRSAFSPHSCTVHKKFERQQQEQHRSRGKPRDDCISCQSGLQPTTCDAQGIVYSLKCQLCGAEYIGETKRTARSRIREHHAQARNNTPNTPWGDHMRLNHAEVEIAKAPVFCNATILATTNREVTRKVREAIEIRDRRPSVNKCKGWHLTG